MCTHEDLSISQCFGCNSEKATQSWESWTLDHLAEASIPSMSDPSGAGVVLVAGCSAPVAFAASMSQPMGVKGLGRKGWTSGFSLIVARFAGGVLLLFALRLGEGLTRVGVPIPLASAAMAALAAPGDAPLPPETLLFGLPGGLEARDVLLLG